MDENFKPQQTLFCRYIKICYDLYPFWKSLEFTKIPKNRIARHNLLRDLIFEAASSASLAPAKVERDLLPGTAAWPGQAMCSSGDGPTGTTSSLASSKLAATGARPGGALDKACMTERCMTPLMPAESRALSFPPSPLRL